MGRRPIRAAVQPGGEPIQYSGRTVLAPAPHRAELGTPSPAVSTSCRGQTYFVAWTLALLVKDASASTLNVLPGAVSGSYPAPLIVLAMILSLLPTSLTPA